MIPKVTPSQGGWHIFARNARDAYASARAPILYIIYIIYITYIYYGVVRRVARVEGRMSSMSCIRTPGSSFRRYLWNHLWRSVTIEIGRIGQPFDIYIVSRFVPV